MVIWLLWTLGQINQGSYYVPCEAKNCTVLFLQQLCQNFIYDDNFRHTYTSTNFLSSMYSIFFI